MKPVVEHDRQTQAKLAQAWRQAHMSAGATLMAATEDGVVVSVTSSQAPDRALCTVYVPPPEVLVLETIFISSSLGTVGGFTKGTHGFLAFKLNLPTP